ncbi:MAG: glutamine--fructose-6-phosphate transaminase (isomerizing) [Verrucomicrobia bacterium]|nr:glutamine--fructose-6-phosphate transaminase (isomerizing) [Verrucomicrobiota bacterium]
MCGIVGYIGARDAQDILITGLKRLEYRGYDSCGIAVLSPAGEIVVAKKEGRISNLEAALADHRLAGTTGIGHTRWATHGRPSDVNAHPHRDGSGSVVLVHNGIIENYGELKEALRLKGHAFESETDTEVVAHLIEDEFENGAATLLEATRTALKRVRGAYALCIMRTSEPDRLIAARSGAPLLMGVGDGEYFLSSDAAPIIPYTRRVLYLNDEELLEIHRDGFTKISLDGEPLESTISQITWTAEEAEKGGYETFMLKEIYEQPAALRRTLSSLIDSKTGELLVENAPLTAERLRSLTDISVVSCGTALHAGMVGTYLANELCGLDVHTEWASEFRYRRLKLNPQRMVLVISQSGETADTLASLRAAKALGAPVLGIINVRESTIARESDHVLYTQAGPEIGVASTKAYTSQIAAMVVFALHLARVRGEMSDDDYNRFMRDLLAVPDVIERMLADITTIKRIADRVYDARSSLYLGRGFNFPSALEGALKNKEISYMHCEGYAAGEMKHGPIALIQARFPIFSVCTKGSTYEKMVSNIKEVGARNGYIVTIATEGDEHIKTISDDVIYVPEVREELSPLVNAVPLQLLAYHIARIRGCDIDKPRNLAKSVTVE